MAILKSRILVVPMWVLIFMVITFMFLAGRMSYLYMNSDYPEAITVNDTRYIKGSEKYNSTVKETKRMFLVFGLGSLVASIATGFITIKKIQRRI